MSLDQWRCLGQPGSLTERLRRLGAFRLRVLRERVGPAAGDEAHAMGVPPRTPCWVREVAMAIDGVECVAARSLTPLPASWQAWLAMRGLSERPLGSMLYDDPDVRRSPFEVGRPRARTALFRVAAAAQPPVDDARRGLWARRSIFWRWEQPLLVAECFLPGFWRAAGQTRD